MTTILKPTIKKILVVFYKNKKESFHLREIARLTKLYGQSVTRYLNQLEKDNILLSRKEGNLKKYSLGKNKTTYSILTLFDIDKFQRLPRIRQDAINYFLEKLPDVPVFAILFGSSAKETYKKDSDIDILLITNRKIETKEAEKEADALAGIKISAFQMAYPKFLKELKMKEDKVVQSAIFSGYTLVNHIFYYEVLYNERI